MRIFVNWQQRLKYLPEFVAHMKVRCRFVIRCACTRAFWLDRFLRRSFVLGRFCHALFISQVIRIGTKDLARSPGQGRAARPHSWLVHLLEAKALIEQRQEEQKLIRRKVQQLRERRKGRPASTPRPVVETAQLTQTQAAMAEPTKAQNDPRTRLLANLTEVL